MYHITPLCICDLVLHRLKDGKSISRIMLLPYSIVNLRYRRRRTSIRPAGRIDIRIDVRIDIPQIVSTASTSPSCTLCNRFQKHALLSYYGTTLISAATYTRPYILYGITYIRHWQQQKFQSCQQLLSGISITAAAAIDDINPFPSSAVVDVHLSSSAVCF